MASRRAFVLSLFGVVCAACAPAESGGLRGVGTVWQPPVQESHVASITENSAPDPFQAPTPVPESPWAPPDAPIVPGPRLPLGGSTEAQAHLLPDVLGRRPAPLALPARRLIVPTIGVDSRVLPIGTYIDRHGELAWETAAFAVGHHRGTAGPGQPGNMVLSGHISSPGEGAVFHRLPELKTGEGIIVRTDERQYLYRVTDVKTVGPREVSVMAQTSDPVVTLITCFPDRIYSHRLIVTGTLVG